MTKPRYFSQLWASALAAALFSLGALVPLHAAANTPASQQTAENNRQFIADAFTQWQQGGKTFFQDVLSPDVVWTIKGTSPVAGTYRGRQDFLDRAVKPFADRLSAPIRPMVRDIWANGNDVVVHWDGATTAADGVPYSNSYVWIFRMKDRRATEVIAFLDLAPYDDVLRRVPAPK
ncbi:nuclear transport factor 2 family protein [Variovorax sp. DXTD-1]|uniref:nuclear transport factor 2 family protein n=1 Tax=Variovorax sp. DXTD-1 TaxID=2495592 RepID=UPI000F88056B|nr:nuclear transport factor 2 family protein [Variovorax sp. DXTD-1]RST45047.1 nuclear transport factor 2 family protein [Variovorax sp. DXTD-1]